MVGSWCCRYIGVNLLPKQHEQVSPMPDQSCPILVTSALPYANGPIHIGHLVEYIQTDVWVRYQKLRGRECYYVCADDAHGTPVMLKAQQEGITPLALIERIGQEHRADFSDFMVAFDNYHSTHSEENRYYANLIYRRLAESGQSPRTAMYCSTIPETVKLSRAGIHAVTLAPGRTLGPHICSWSTPQCHTVHEHETCRY